MLRAKEGIRVSALVAIALLSGCGSKPAAPYPRYGGVEAEVAQPEGGFALLVEAAKSTEMRCPDSLTRTDWTPQAQAVVVGQLEVPLATLLKLRKTSVDFDYQATQPFAPAPYRAGWGLLGKAAAWKIRLLVESENYDSAIQYLLAATKFGFDLLGGNSRDASLGLTIADQARREFLPALTKLNPKQLQALYEGLRTLDEQRPTLETTFRNDEKDMLEVVQFVQDAYQRRDYKTLRTQLGKDIEPALDALEKLRANDADKRPAYFEGFAQEARDLAAFRLASVPLDAQARNKRTPKALNSDRPWRRFSRYFFLMSDAMFLMADMTIARTRLLGLHAWIRAQMTANGSAPTSFDGPPVGFVRDPLTGKPFVLHADGTTYRLYSAGIDARDDGGESDPAFQAPDLTLESHEL